MMGGDVNRQAPRLPIQVLVNYWEIRPSLMGARLDELVRRGVTQVASFVPWQAVESDIAHRLTRYLQAANERRLAVALILTPEVGVHYSHSGLPKDVLGRADNLAKTAGGKSCSVTLPPNSFPLPSLLAPEFLKRFQSFLARIDSLLGTLERAQGNPLQRVELFLSGSYWKYYRSAMLGGSEPFSGQTGDQSPAAALSFRRHLEQYYAQREFQEPTAISVNRWKARQLDEVNRRCFCQLAEDLFRSRNSQLLRRKISGLPTHDVELFTPEADPSLQFSQFLQIVAGGHSDFSRLSDLLDQYATRASAAFGKATAPMVRFSSFGGFQSLSDSEKQYLILKSLLLFGARKGCVLIDEDEWLQFSPAFRSRLDSFSRAIFEGELELRNRALYLTPHLWSGASDLWAQIFAQSGAQARQIASLDLMQKEQSARVLFVDPSCILMKDGLGKILTWMRAGNLVVLPRTSLYTSGASALLEGELQASRRMDISLGITYQLHPLGNGKLVIYEQGEYEETHLKSFVGAMLALGEFSRPCNLSDGRLMTLPISKRRGGMGLFVMNPTSRAVTADVFFSREAKVSDLMLNLAQGRTDQSGPAHTVVSEDTGPRPSTRFSLEVPPCGILALAIEGADIEREGTSSLPEFQPDVDPRSERDKDETFGGGTSWN